MNNPKSDESVPVKHKHEYKYWVRQFGIEPIDWVWACECGAEITGEEMYGG